MTQAAPAPSMLVCGEYRAQCHDACNASREVSRTFTGPDGRSDDLLLGARRPKGAPISSPLPWRRHRSRSASAARSSATSLSRALRRAALTLSPLRQQAGVRVARPAQTCGALAQLLATCDNAQGATVLDRLLAGQSAGRWPHAPAAAQRAPGRRGRPRGRAPQGQLRLRQLARPLAQLGARHRQLRAQALGARGGQPRQRVRRRGRVLRRPRSPPVKCAGPYCAHVRTASAYEQSTACSRCTQKYHYSKIARAG